jgi:hypothetical protein
MTVSIARGASVFGSHFVTANIGTGIATVAIIAAVVALLLVALSRGGRR